MNKTLKLILIVCLLLVVIGAYNDYNESKKKHADQFAQIKDADKYQSTTQSAKQSSAYQSNKYENILQTDHDTANAMRTIHQREAFYDIKQEDRLDSLNQHILYVSANTYDLTQVKADDFADKLWKAKYRIYYGMEVDITDFDTGAVYHIERQNQVIENTEDDVSVSDLPDVNYSDPSRGYATQEQRKSFYNENQTVKLDGRNKRILYVTADTYDLDQVKADDYANEIWESEKSYDGMVADITDFDTGNMYQIHRGDTMPGMLHVHNNEII